MASKDRCPRCGAMVLPTEKYCPQCGAKLILDAPESAESRPVAEPVAVPFAEPETARPSETPQVEVDALPNIPAARTQGGPPRTIEELQAFCAVNEMPLERMRFFIGTNIREPRAFGIYRDGDNFVVYKNKDDGSRAVRYHGPDEAWAVKELYEKLLDECHRRDIWPDGKPEGYDEARLEARRKARRRSTIITVVTVVVILAISALFMYLDNRKHRGDGYYRFGDSGTYYRYGGDWYYYDTYYDWVPADDYPYYDDYGDYYVGNDYDRAWGGSDFKSSDTWRSIESESHTNSSDYDSWDSGDTDWSSDW